MHRALPPLLLLTPGLALAAPDPMSAGTSLEKVVIDAGTGDVTVKITKTQHLKVDGAERDAKRDGGVVTIRRAIEDVALTMPPNAALEVTAGTGDVTIQGASTSVVVKAASGDVRVTGSVKRLKVETGSGEVWLDLGFHPAASVKVTSGSGDIALTMSGEVTPKIEASSKSGAVTGAKLGATKSGAQVLLKTASGDVTVKRE